MEHWLFYIFSALTLVFALLVVLNPFSRNPVNSAMFLVLAMGSLAGLFVMLHAFFLAAVQIIVYTGAVMVLFLFILMSVDMKEEFKRKLSGTSVALGLVFAGSVGSLFLLTIDKFAASPATPTVEGGTRELGKLLFTQYLLPFEIVSILLLVSMVGVVLLSKKNLK